jgi:hypothetical protein
MSNDEKIKAAEESIAELLMKSGLTYTDALVALFKVPKLFEKKMENKIRNKVVTEAEAESDSDNA